MEMKVKLKGKKIKKGSKICPLGTVSVIDMGQTEEVGRIVEMQLWSPVLYQYRTEDCRLDSTDDGILVLNRNGGFKDFIDQKDIFPIQGDYVFWVGRHGWVMNDPDPRNQEHVLDSLEKAVAGKTPEFCDNSRFLKVPPENEGQRLIALQLMDGNWILFDDKHAIVKHETLQPLTFDQWGLNKI